MCAAVPAALLLLVILAALTILRLSATTPNARLLATLLDSLHHDPEPDGRTTKTSPPSTTSTPHRAGRPGTA